MPSGRNCAICRHPTWAEIAAALAGGLPEPATALRFTLGTGVVRYHHLRHQLGVAATPLHCYRRCPACGVVRAASAFRRAAGGTKAEQRVCCPKCGHVAPLLGFRLAEPPAADEGDEGLRQ